MTRQRGFTLVEMVISLAITALLLLGFGSVISTGRAGSTSANAWMDLDEKLQRLERRIIEEVRWASVVGEDTNTNLVLDEGEDRNGNGRLDSDWRVGPDSITFNRVMADGNPTLPVTYRLSAGAIERVAMVDPAGTLATTIMVRDVLRFDTEQSGASVTVRLRFRSELAGGKAVERQRTFTVRARN